MPNDAEIYIGVDEAGRGPVLGPLVIAGVKTRDPETLAKLGVRDSKLLSRKQRESMFNSITELCEAHVVIITAREIDTQRKNASLNQIEASHFAKAIDGLLKDEVVGKGSNIKIFLDAADVNAEHFGAMVLESMSEGVDGSVEEGGIDGIDEVAGKGEMARIVGAVGNEKIAGKDGREEIEGDVPPAISRQKGGFELISEHKADEKYPVVSAASIIAKVTRDREMDRLSSQYGELGSGYPADPITRLYLTMLFRERGEIPDFVRQSWDTVRKIREGLKVTRLDDFF